MIKFCKELSLAYLNPKLAKEWDYEKNYPLIPEDVRCGSNKKIAWVCKKCYNSWSATIYNRNHGSGCPYCSGRKAYIDNCLATLRPDLAKEWDYEKNGKLTPYNVTVNSGKNIGWICSKKHKYNAIINERSRSGHTSGCPYCSGHRVCIDNCLATLRPDLAKEWDYEKNGRLTPYDVTSCSYKKVKWKCEVGHGYIARISSRGRRYSSGCPYCSGNKVCNDNCLAVVNPKLAKEWDYEKNGKLTPYDITYGSSRKVGWKCKKNHRWVASVSNRKVGQRCPYCSGKRARQDNCLAALIPELVKEWDYERNYPLTPRKVGCYSSRKVGWKCKKNHRWVARISDRSRGDDCPYCNKIELKNGIFCDSKPEAYYCQKLDDSGIKFKHHVKIGLGKCTCDFYISTTNTYIEVTGYDKRFNHWKTYRKGIIRKKAYITKTLKAKFKFVQLKLSPKQIQYVRENSI